MQKYFIRWTAVLLCLGGGVALRPWAQQLVIKTAETVPSSKKPYFIDPQQFDAHEFVLDPPQADSSITQGELKELHRIEQERTAHEVELAKQDDQEEDIFIYKTVLGSSFRPEDFPATARLSDHLKKDQGAMGNSLKGYYQRKRPYQADATLHPVCALKTTHDSYPSGHALTGYLEALALAELVPGQRIPIFQRADEYAHNRIVCGVHYPSDTEASRRLAYAMYGYMVSTPKFREELSEARAELSAKLWGQHNKVR